MCDPGFEILTNFTDIYSDEESSHLSYYNSTLIEAIFDNLNGTSNLTGDFLRAINHTENFTSFEGFLSTLKKIENFTSISHLSDIYNSTTLDDLIDAMSSDLNNLNNSYIWEIYKNMTIMGFNQKDLDDYLSLANNRSGSIDDYSNSKQYNLTIGNLTNIMVRHNSMTTSTTTTTKFTTTTKLSGGGPCASHIVRTNIADPTDPTCASFITCLNGAQVGTSISCGVGTKFSFDAQTCDWPANVQDCGSTPFTNSSMKKITMHFNSTRNLTNIKTDFLPINLSLNVTVIESFRSSLMRIDNFTNMGELLDTYNSTSIEDLIITMSNDLNSLRNFPLSEILDVLNITDMNNYFGSVNNLSHFESFTRDKLVICSQGLDIDVPWEAEPPEECERERRMQTLLSEHKVVSYIMEGVFFRYPMFPISIQRLH